MVQERQTTRFAAQRGGAEAGKENGIVIRFRAVFGHHAERLMDAVIVDHLYELLPPFLRIFLRCMMQLHLPADIEKAASKQPFTHVVIRRIAVEILR